jgi:hypothetical protein
MSIHPDKTTKNKSKTPVHDSKPTVKITDSNSGAITQNKLQEAANNSSQVKQLEAYQAMADNYTSQAIQKKENNTGLPDQLKSGVESLSGMSMDHVKVHYNSAKPAQLNALAYAQGSDIHIGSGQEQHLPHEAWHVVQQAQGRVKPTMQMKGAAINDDEALEHEADVMGANALASGKSEGTGEVVQQAGFQENNVAQLAPDDVTGRLDEAKAGSIDTLLKNNGIVPELFIAADWTTLQSSYRNLVATNARLIKANGAAKKRPLRAKIATDYDALLTSARAFQQACINNPWAIAEGPAPNGGKLEIKLRQQDYRAESPAYTIHVSLKRHLYENYWILANDDATATEDLNTLAYCDAAAFSTAFTTFGTAMAAALNARHYSKRRDPFDGKGLNYDFGAGPKFETDKSGYNMHSFPVTTAGTAITLNRVEHLNLKIALRGMSAAENTATRRQGKAAWLNISDSANVRTILAATGDLGGVEHMR